MEQYEFFANYELVNNQWVLLEKYTTESLSTARSYNSQLRSANPHKSYIAVRAVVADYSIDEVPEQLSFDEGIRLAVDTENYWNAIKGGR